MVIYYLRLLLPNTVRTFHTKLRINYTQKLHQCLTLFYFTYIKNSSTFIIAFYQQTLLSEFSQPFYLCFLFDKSSLKVLDQKGEQLQIIGRWRYNDKWSELCKKIRSVLQFLLLSHFLFNFKSTLSNEFSALKQYSRQKSQLLI